MSIQLNLPIATAYAIPGPKYMVLNGVHADVYTGSDIPVTPSVRTISPFEFINRFTPTEWAACLSFTYSGAGNPTAMGIMLQLQTSPTVGLDDAATIQGMAFWVANGCITAARSAIILSQGN